MRAFLRFPLLLILAGLVVLPAGAASASRSTTRVVIVAIGGTSLHDWQVADAPSLQQLLGDGASGLLSTRTARPPRTEPCVPGANSSVASGSSAGIATLLQGSASLRTAVDASALALATSRKEAAFRREVLPQLADATVPGGVRLDVESAIAAIRVEAGITLITLDDARVADCNADGARRDGLVALSMRRADQIVGHVRRMLSADDTLIVLSDTAPRRQVRARNLLTPIAILGRGFPAGRALESQTTRRRGVVALIDVASTAVAALGSSADVRVGDGRVITARSQSAASLKADLRKYQSTADLRSPALRTYVWIGSFAVLLAAVIVIAGRGVSSPRHVPRTSRDAIALLLCAVVAAPVAMMLEPLLGFDSSVPRAAVIAALSISFAVAVRMLIGPRRVIGVLAAATLIVIVGDLVMGAPLAARSVGSYSIAEGARFYGIGNEMMGVVVAAALLWAGSALDVARRRPVMPVVAVLVVVAALMSAPVIGAKFGATFVAVPAFGLLTVRALGQTFDRRALLAVAIATLFAAGIFVAMDFLASPDAQTHVAAAASGGAEGGGVLARKVSAAARLALGSYWTVGIAICAAVVALLTRRRSALLARGLWSRPHLRTSLMGCAVAVVGALAFNDAGIVAAAFIMLTATSALLHALLVEQAIPVRRSQRLDRLKQFAR